MTISVESVVNFHAEVNEALSCEPICPVKGALVDASGEVIRTNVCSRLYCPVCWRFAVRRRAGAIRRAQPERFLRYSAHRHVTPAQMRGMINGLHRRLRRHGYVFEAAWHVEPNSVDGGAHVHLWQHGSFVPVGVLLNAAERVGLDDVWVGVWEDHTPRGYMYGMKLALDDRTREDLAYWNMGRLGGATRHFWRDGAGGPSMTLKDAMRPARGRRS